MEKQKKIRKTSSVSIRDTRKGMESKTETKKKTNNYMFKFKYEKQWELRSILMADHICVFKREKKNTATGKKEIETEEINLGRMVVKVRKNMEPVRKKIRRILREKNIKEYPEYIMIVNAKFGGYGCDES